jgi:hypothetical protein
VLTIRARVPESLADAAGKRAGLPPGVPRAALVRKCLAIVAGWPTEAAEAVAVLRSPSAPARRALGPRG